MSRLLPRRYGEWRSEWGASTRLCSKEAALLACRDVQIGGYITLVWHRLEQVELWSRRSHESAARCGHRGWLWYVRRLLSLRLDLRLGLSRLGLLLQGGGLLVLLELAEVDLRQIRSLHTISAAPRRQSSSPTFSMTA